MKFTINVELIRDYGYKQLQELEIDELAALIMKSLQDGFEMNNIILDGVTEIHKESDE